MVVRRGRIRRIGWVIKTLEAQVGQFCLSCKCPVSLGNVVQEQDPLGDLPVALAHAVYYMYCMKHHPRLNRPANCVSLLRDAAHRRHQEGRHISSVLVFYAIRIFFFLIYACNRSTSFCAQMFAEETLDGRTASCKGLLCSTYCHGNRTPRH